ncbi:hypothetical protein BW897_28815 [Bacillus cereus]|uniref:Uncharacterized protein n=1 Tax=Bacillus cereus TaxID=1396 RepID=A0A1S9TGR0_BACCE|nr:hypothetical protein BW897_28815 [Bacillus cereus]QBP90095.1 hypothetical protein E1A90_00435 [Bacillus mycoides]QWH75780.1 hypothetical protein EXW59_02890 [Bacillus mycoides]
MIANMMRKIPIGLIIAVQITVISSSLMAVLNNKNIKILVKVYIMAFECTYVELWAITLNEN